MVAVTPMPSLKDIQDILERLLRKECTVTRHAEQLAVGKGVIVAACVGSRLQREAVVATDIPLAAYLGAAIGLLPPGGAQDAAEENRLSTTLLENVTEVLQITASLFNSSSDAPHVKTEKVYDSTAAPLPGDLGVLLRSNNRRLDAVVELAGYGSGRLALVIR